MYSLDSHITIASISTATVAATPYYGSVPLLLQFCPGCLVKLRSLTTAHMRLWHAGLPNMPPEGVGGTTWTSEVGQWHRAVLQKGRPATSNTNPKPWEDPKNGSTSTLQNLHHGSIRLQNWGFCFLDPPRALGY